MIEMLRGVVAHKTPLCVVLDCQGVGYGVQVTSRCGEMVPGVGQELSLFTHLVVREDSLTLFGFIDPQEKEVFLNMIEVTGVGPKLAQRILSSVDPGDLLSLIAREDHRGLSKIKGIGKKTSELLVLALKDKALALSALGADNKPRLLLPPTQQEAILALHTLGVKEPTASKAVDAAIASLGPDCDSGKLITEALRHI